MTLKEVFTDPISVALGVTATIGHALGIPWIHAITATVWAKASTLFTAFSVAGLTLGPQLSWLPQGPLTALALVFGSMYVAKLLSRVYESYQTRTES